MAFLQFLGMDVWASFIVDPGFTHDDFKKLKDYITAHGLKTPAFSVLTPLPGTGLFSRLQNRLTTTNSTLYDIAPAVLPTRLPLREFYAEFCSLYKLSYSKYQLIWEGFLAWVSRGFTLRRLFAMIDSAKHLSDPESHMKAPTALVTGPLSN